MTRGRVTLVARAAAVIAILLVLAACQAKADVTVAVRPNGSGTVTAVVTLDKEAAAKVPDLKAGLRRDGLAADGWAITGPTTAADGSVSVTATHSVARAADFGPVLDQLTGPNGPLSHGTVTRTHSFGSTSYSFDLDLDLSKGTAAFADPAFTKLLGGQTLDQLLANSPNVGGPGASVNVHVTLPGAKATQDWNRQLGAPAVHLHTASKRQSNTAMLFAVVALVALIGAVVTFYLVRLATRR